MLILLSTAGITCTDEDNEDFGDESKFYDEDGVLIGVAYIEKARTVQPSFKNEVGIIC